MIFFHRRTLEPETSPKGIRTGFSRGIRHAVYGEQAGNHRMKRRFCLSFNCRAERETRLIFFWVEKYSIVNSIGPALCRENCPTRQSYGGKGRGGKTKAKSVTTDGSFEAGGQRRNDGFSFWQRPPRGTYMTSACRVWGGVWGTRRSIPEARNTV